MTGARREPLYLLLAATSLLLLIACANVAGLMLARWLGRSHEIAIRIALGAGLRALLRQFLVESAIITLVSGIAGLALGVGVCLLLKFVPHPDFVPHPVISPVAIAASLTTLTAITLFAGMYPALRAADLSPMECLRTE